MWDKVLEMGIEDNSDASIASDLSTVTAGHIPNAVAKEFLRDSGLWYQSSPGTMGGAIQDAIDGNQISDSAKGSLGVLFSALWGEGASIRMDLPQYAGMVDAAFNEMVGACVTQGQADAWYSLAGGRPYAGVVGADVAAARAAATAELAVQQVQSDYRSALNTAGVNEAYANGDRAGLVAGLRAAADQLEA
jgi:hypothetical protein